MNFPSPLQPARLIKRYKRFLADVELPDGRVLTVHCPNSGSMLGCSESGSEVMISKSGNPNRKYPHTLEMVKTGSVWAGINTSLTNHLVREGIENHVFPELEPFSSIRAEVKTGDSRLDFLLTHMEHQTYLEVKNCTLVRAGAAMFPDAVTARGTKHLQELMRLRNYGHRAVLIFCVQREDADRFTPAADIDPLYTSTLAEASDHGVLILACRAAVRPLSIIVHSQLPVELPRR
ncbi:MAG: DNA/RNA nuclease SfsA [Proteobacteria bacterium]|nr:DNA/RNA nuclease SfsA [Pseudomonadota bacterium]MBU1737203.1 DNA/RNA nuclease SfsA [Pseudomonadota bacterium]